MDRTQTWSPDFCGCVIEQRTDGKGRVEFSRVIKKCDSHRRVFNRNLYGVLLTNEDSECKILHKVRTELYDDDACETEQFNIVKHVDTGHGETVVHDKSVGCNYKFTGEGDKRRLEVSFKKFDQKHKMALQGCCDRRFKGRVIVA